MNQFNLQNWRIALSAVYALAAQDVAYRKLCLTNPRAAVQRVSKIELPPSFRFDFVAEAENISSSFLLPPLLAPVVPKSLSEAEQDIKQFTDWYVTSFPFDTPLNLHTIGGGTHTGDSTTGNTSDTGSGGTPGTGVA